MSRRPGAAAPAGPPPPDDPQQRGLWVRADIDRGSFRVSVEVAVAAGEVLGVIGPNGAGKSTLLRALSGLVPITAGLITLDGRRIDEPAAGVFVPPERRPVGLVFQNYRLFPHLSVRDNVAFAARSRGAGRRSARRQAQGFLERFDLVGLADRKPVALSGGQAQLVSLARALAAQPSMLLLDEPLAALDARTKLDVRTELRRHLREFDGPTLLVTHDPLEAMVMTDRLIVIEEGLVVQTGTPAEVARRPATPYIARLVGLNLYPGALGADRQIALDNGGVLIASQQTAPSDPADRDGTGDDDAAEDWPRIGGRVLAAVRPSAIALHTTRPEHSSPRNVWPGVVTGLELLTDRIRVVVEGSPPALVDITADAVADLHLTGGDRVWLSVKATEVDVYPQGPTTSSRTGPAPA